MSSRCEQICRHNEAFWQTGTFNPPNFIPPQPPITDHEQQAFQSFHSVRTQLYSCVLPGEIIRQCVEATVAGILYPNELVQLEHLIVDEFQDLILLIRGSLTILSKHRLVSLSLATTTKVFTRFGLPPHKAFKTSWRTTPVRPVTCCSTAFDTEQTF